MKGIVMNLPECGMAKSHAAARPKTIPGDAA